MSKQQYDENPFGDPFSDPSIQQAVSTPVSVQQGIEDYNPFAADQASVHRPTVRGASNPPLNNYGANTGGGPAIMTPTQDSTVPSPAYNKSAQQNVSQQQPPLLTTAELQRRQEELDRKAAELDRRERELRSTNVRKNNWPPLPSWFCYQPCFYIDIPVEIPPDFQTIVKQIENLWVFHTGLLLANIVGAMLLLFYHGDFTRFISAILFALILTPASFMCWFRPLYKAFRDDSSFNFMVFFFIFFFQFLIAVDQSLGLGSSGFCGIFTAFSLYDGTFVGTLVAIVVTFIAVGFCCSACFDLLLITKVHRIYRSSGASVQKAQAEFARGIFTNEHVRGASRNMAESMVRNQFNGATGSRY